MQIWDWDHNVYIWYVVSATKTILSFSFSGLGTPTKVDEAPILYTGVSLACHLLPIGCIRTFLGDLLQHVCSHWLTNCSIVWDFVYTCKCPTFHQILLDSSLTWTKRTVDKLQVRAIYWIYGHYVELEVLMWVFGLAKLTVSCHSGQSPTLSVRYFATNTCHQFVLKQCK